MALKFQCANCGKDIAVRFLKVGEAAECKSCRASNSVPESAEEISDEAAERMIKAPVSESSESIGDPTKSLPIVKALRIIGALSIGFAVVAGVAIFIAIISQPESPDLGVSQASQTISGILSALGLMLFFGGLGTFALGIAKILELLSK
ncbi:hypothetical protein F4X33_20820 [Candidatus Poribacteria bacterium]|nr:hypothetical protein [Candidatus Poribacteria bacterium]